jgi:hypothetical protein
MALTPALLADYAGHEVFLRQRARHAPHCFERFDLVRACLIRRITDERACEAVLRDYRPCARELHKAKLAAGLASDDERRRLLSAKAGALAAAAAARGAGAAAAAEG